MWVLILQRLTIEFFLDLFYFPIWWYTEGARRTALFCVRLFQTGNTALAPGLWLKNIFVPMYGQYDWQGRLMSFFMRSVNVLFRTIGLFFWTLFVITVFLCWLALPIVIVVFMLRAFAIG